MMRSISHRGPDAAGLWLHESGRLAFGHQRLSVIDLSDAGNQPMTSSDGRWTITYNGEIYNTSEIRRLLGNLEYRGHSDTEVLVEALSHWGIERTIRKITGMFAFAAWDSHRNELWLSRDRFGEKPLYYGWHDGLFLFGSEMRSLIAVLGHSPEIDRQALGMLVRQLAIPCPFTIYRNFRKLPPGSLLCIQKAGEELVPVRYWDPVTVAQDISVNQPRGLEAVDELEDLLTTTVRSRMESDVPLGAFLSGGIDSSIVVALMQKISNKDIKTFTIGFRDVNYDESQYASAIATHLQTDHQCMNIGASDAISAIAKMPQIYDEPFADSSQIPTYLVSCLAKTEVTVALSGDGGDELFGGYDRYQAFEQFGRLKGRMPQALSVTAGRAIRSLKVDTWNKVGASPVKKMLPRSLQIRTGEKVHKFARLLISDKSDLDLYREFVSANSNPEDLVIGFVDFATNHRVPANRSGYESAMLIDVSSYLPDDVLTKVDRASMAASLEVRVPLLDPDVFSFAWGLHPEDRVKNGVGKWPLRQLLQRYIPVEFVNRPKMGFGVPVGSWLRHELRVWASELLDPHLLREQGFFYVDPIQRMWNEHLSGKIDRASELWPILMFQAWFQERHSL